tara:strand:+ start:236 stop:1333 length:1098 start_codon:yes stop_codon:yes gene_type:complete
LKNYNNPVKIIYSDDWKTDLFSKIESLNLSNPIIITSEGNRKRQNVDQIFSSGSIFSNVKSNPTFQDGEALIDFCSNKRFNSVIAIGGGSVMDLAKVGIAYLSLNINKIEKLINYKKNYMKNISSIFLPTTHGTASEVTMWGTIWNMIEKRKYSISHPKLYPNYAILDPNLTLSLPLDISITTTMDALSHSFESIWNKNSNSKSTTHAISAISSIIKNAPLLKTNLDDIKIRNNLLKSSAEAGLAFSNTMTAAAHSISYPLTIKYGIPHGIASSITLVPLLKTNKNFIKSPLNQLINKNKLSFDELINKIEEIPEGVISYKLRDWGVLESELPDITKDSFTKGRIDNNIVDLDRNDILNILKSVY